MAGLVMWMVAGIMLWAVVSARRQGGGARIVEGSAPAADRFAEFEALDPYRAAMEGRLPNAAVNQLMAPPPLGHATVPVGDPTWPSDGRL